MEDMCYEPQPVLTSLTTTHWCTGKGRWWPRLARRSGASNLDGDARHFVAIEGVGRSVHVHELRHASFRPWGGWGDTRALEQSAAAFHGALSESG